MAFDSSGLFHTLVAPCQLRLINTEYMPARDVSKLALLIKRVLKPKVCAYQLVVCSALLCPDQSDLLLEEDAHGGHASTWGSRSQNQTLSEVRKDVSTVNIPQPYLSHRLFVLLQHNYYSQHILFTTLTTSSFVILPSFLPTFLPSNFSIYFPLLSSLAFSLFFSLTSSFLCPLFFLPWLPTYPSSFLSLYPLGDAFIVLQVHPETRRVVDV